MSWVYFRLSLFWWSGIILLVTGLSSGSTAEHRQFQIDIIMPPPLIGGGIKRCFCMTSVWRLSVWRLTSDAYIGPKSRTERSYEYQNWHRSSPRHTWLGHHFQGQKVKGQGHQAAALLTAVLARQAAAAVGVGTCWPWESAATLPAARRRKALRRQRWRRGAGHTVAAAARLQLVRLLFAAQYGTRNVSICVMRSISATVNNRAIRPTTYRPIKGISVRQSWTSSAKGYPLGHFYLRQEV